MTTPLTLRATGQDSPHRPRRPAPPIFLTPLWALIRTGITTRIAIARTAATKLSRGMRRAVLASSARAYERTKVTDVTRSGGKVGLSTPHGTVRVDKAVLATNAYSGEWDITPARLSVPMWIIELETEPIAPERIAPCGLSTALPTWSTAVGAAPSAPPPVRTDQPSRAGPAARARTGTPWSSARPLCHPCQPARGVGAALAGSGVRLFTAPVGPRAGRRAGRGRARRAGGAGG
ncbi:FAD-dependent oxidoreductase [Kitasatospora xanthocidica]|uniref:FAD-dependent oxidoreductase n=1 Tax=Kitasatospora xanthocidica TaxID=83382 RepID=UPI0036E6B4D6